MRKTAFLQPLVENAIRHGLMKRLAGGNVSTAGKILAVVFSTIFSQFLKTKGDFVDLENFNLENFYQLGTHGKG